MNINATELRIGNYLKRLDDSIFQVTSSDIVRIEELHKDLRPLPIPLTDEWLIRMGFEEEYKSHIHSVFAIGNGKFSYYFWYNDKRQYLSISGTNFVCNYVHCLQNIIHSLTGKELTIKE